MKFLIWDTESEELESFFDTAETFANLDIFEDSSDLVEELIDGDVIVFDLDSAQKDIEKAVKKIKKAKIDCVIIYLTNKLDDKKIEKHQKSKVGGQLYVRTPIDESMLANMLQPFVDEKIQIGLSEDDQNKILKGHVDAGELSDAVQELSNKFDSIFSEVFGENQAQAALSVAEEKTDHSIQASEDAPLDVGLDDDEGEDLLATDEGEDLLATDEGEDLLASDEESDALEIADDEGFELAEETDEEETKLPDDDDLAFPDMDDLAYPDMESESSDNNAPMEASEDLAEDFADGGLDLSANEEPLMAADDNDDLTLDETASVDSGVEELDLSGDAGDELSLSEDDGASNTIDPEDGALDLSADDAGAELSLGDDEDVAIIDTTEEGALDLSADDAGAELSLGDDEDAAIIDTSEDGALDLSDDALTDPGTLSNDDELSLSADDGDLGVDLSDDLGGDLSADLSADSSADSDDMGLEFGEEAENDLSDLDFGAPEEAASEEASASEMSLDAGDDALGDDLLGDDLSLSDEMSDDELFGAGEDMDADLGDLGGDDALADLDTDLGALGEMDDLSDNAASLSADQLPDSPDLGEDPNLSTNAKVQLAEIDAMMNDSDDVLTTVEATQTKTDGLAKELNAMSPEFNATSDDKTEIIEQAPKANKPMEAPYKTEPNISANQLNEHREVMAHNSEELSRLGETIKNLREDREKLLERIYHFEEEKNKEKEDFINLQAELDEKKIELSLARKRYEKQIEDYKYQLDIVNQKKQMLEEKNKQLDRDVERLSKKSNVDMTRIRARETELENKLDLLRADSEMQIKNRDQKILELKRRIDTLEFDIESMHMKERKVVDNNLELEDKMDRVIRTLRHAIGELEDNDNSIHHLEKVKKNLDI